MIESQREKTWLVVGLLIGAAVAALVFWGSQYMTSRQQPSAAVAANSTDATTPPEAPAPADASASVQLSDQEQKSIGVETVEVQRRSIGREITTPGKVAEPETGIGSISARISGRIEKLL